MKLSLARQGMRNIGERRVAGAVVPVLANLSQDFLRPFLPPKPFAGKVIETSAQISLQWMKVGLSSFCLVPDLSEANMYTQFMA